MVIPAFFRSAFVIETTHEIRKASPPARTIATSGGIVFPVCSVHTQFMTSASPVAEVEIAVPFFERASTVPVFCSGAWKSLLSFIALLYNTEFKGEKVRLGRLLHYVVRSASGHTLERAGKIISHAVIPHPRIRVYIKRVMVEVVCRAGNRSIKEHVRPYR